MRKMPDIGRRGCLVATGAALVAATPGTGLVRQAQAQAPVKGVGTLTVLQAAVALAGGPFLAAVTLDTFKAYGLTVELGPRMAGSGAVISALAGRHADLGYVGVTPAFDAMLQGVPVQVVDVLTWTVLDLSLRTAVSAKLSIPADAPVDQKFKALKGLTIASSEPGGSSSLTLQALLRRYGADGVNVMPADQLSTMSGLRQGRFDGGFWSPGTMEANYSDGSARKWIEVRKEVPGYDSLMLGAIVGLRDLNTKKPEALKAFVAGVRDAGKAIERNPDEVAKAVKGRFFPHMPEGEFLGGWNSMLTGMNLDGSISPTQFKEHLRLQGELFKKNYDSITYDQAIYSGIRKP